MDELLYLIVGTSTTLDVYVICRLVILNMALELFTVACAMLGGMKTR